MLKASYEIAAGRLHLRLAQLSREEADAARDLAFAADSYGFVRSFVQDDAAAARRIGERFCAVAEALIRQTAREVEVPWEQALEAWLVRVGDARIDWWLAGSAAPAVRGLAVRPRDIDIITDDRGAQQLAELFSAELIEPTVPVDGWICRWFGRAFLHARFEWVGGVLDVVDRPLPGDFGPAAAQALEVVVWRGFLLRVPPLELQLAVSERRGMTERAAVIRAALGG